MLGLTRELGGRFFLNLARTTPALPCERVTCTASRVGTQLLMTTDTPCPPDSCCEAPRRVLGAVRNIVSVRQQAILHVSSTGNTVIKGSW